MCQRPERASFISTVLKQWLEDYYNMCQRPERASFISTNAAVYGNTVVCGVSTP